MTTKYEVIRRPIITEKTAYQSSNLNQYAFEVHKSATKAQVRNAVEDLFDVEVDKVNIINVPAKRTRRGLSRRIVTRRTAYKKAVVTLAAGETIDVFEGVG